MRCNCRSACAAQSHHFHLFCKRVTEYPFKSFCKAQVFISTTSVARRLYIFKLINMFSKSSAQKTRSHSRWVLTNMEKSFLNNGQSRYEKFRWSKRTMIFALLIFVEYAYWVSASKITSRSFCWKIWSRVRPYLSAKYLDVVLWYRSIIEMNLYSNAVEVHLLACEKVRTWFSNL